MDGLRYVAMRDDDDDDDDVDVGDDEDEDMTNSKIEILCKIPAAAISGCVWVGLFRFCPRIDFTAVLQQKIKNLN